MATLEKPKQKKKKKVRANSVAEECATENVQWSNADIEFPSTSTSDEIEIISQPDDETICKLLSALPMPHEATEHSTKNDDIEKCTTDLQSSSDNPVFPVNFAVSENLALDDQNKTDSVGEKADDQNDQIEEKQSDEVEIEDATPSAPSAPLIEDEPEVDRKLQIDQPLSKLLYPNLKGVRLHELTANLTQSSKERLILQPFKKEQLIELYSNPQQALAEAFEADFINTELNNTYKDNPLHELIKKYSHSRYNLKVNTLDLHAYIKCFQENSHKVWIIENRITTYEGVCADGERVRKNELYEFAVLNEQTFQKLSSNLNNTLQLVCYSFMTNLYACESYRTQIEQSIRELLSHSAFSDIRTATPTALSRTLNAEILEVIREVRVTISILFSFLRRQVPDKEFSNDIKKWLEKMAAYYVRVATWQDHLFLIYHVLRCPPGIAGWATSLIQIPKPKSNETTPFTSEEINHCVTFLKVLLMPTKQRKEFLEHLHSENGPIDATTEDLWIIIDSDGEEDSTPAGECSTLKENDLIALLNQVPFEHLFKSMTFTSMNGDFKKINKTMISGYHLLKFIAFSTNLVELLGEGLKTYASEKYRQFAKLLSRLVRHSVQYVSDMHVIFKTGDSMKDDQLLARIQIEFDTFVLRASNYVYLSRFLGAWQYLATLPFSEVHITTTWKLYYMLTYGFSQDLIENVTDDFRVKVSQSVFLENFNSIVVDVPAEDMYYLLQTFASMALTREIDDIDFIRCITTDLFKVGFINALTRDNCYKIVRDLLVNITSKHPDLISDLLTLLRENMKIIDKYGTYLFKSLPLDEWRPPMETFEICANWLLNCGFESRESAMARTIFSRLNWNFDKLSGELFLPYEIHVRMASLIVDVSTKHVPETIGSSGISESVRQMSNLVKGQSPHQQFTMWCWNMISVLRLHTFDQNTNSIRRTIRNPADALRFVNELERLPSIAQGVSENRPIAVYISLLATLWGHSVPLICHKGFPHMQQLLNDYRYSTVIRCLQLVTPLFLDCPESLCKCQTFQTIVNTILQADRTYIRMAKDFISCDYPGPVVELFSKMIQAQIIDYHSFDFQSPVMLISMWLNCLTVNPQWYKDPNAVYIVDIILRIAYQFADAWIAAKNFFKYFCKTNSEPKSSVSSTFIPFLGGLQPSGLFSTHSATTPWLALLTLEIEHELFESETKLWIELVRQLHASPAKFSMDNLIKSSAKAVGCPPCAANSLVIYKLANFIVTLPPQEELLPIFGQQFFLLYLSRIRFNPDEHRFTDVYGVADKLYDFNIPLMKKLKKFFIDCAKFEKERSIKADDQNMSDFYSARSQLYNSFELWLEETRLNKIFHLRPESFPPAYDLNRLALIFANNNAYWTEYIHLANIRQIQREAADAWLRTCLRYVSMSKHASTLSKATKTTNPADNIVRLLDSYDAPVPAPNVPIEQLLVKKMSIAELKRNILRTMQNDFKKIDELSRVFHMDVQELSSLDGLYKEMLRILHENKCRQERREVRCGSIMSSKSCRGGVYVNVNIPYHEINDVVSSKLRSNRDRHEELINKLISAPTLAQILPIVQIQFSIKRLLESYRYFKHINDEAQLKEITTIANTFFYYMINAINENINSFHPAQDLCTVVLSQIGIFLQENQNTEGMNLLKTALKRPDLIKPISDLFVPSATVPEVFLQLYKFIIDSHLKNCDPKILFVLLSKFDVNSWLTTHKPKLADINSLVQLILQGLECWNKNESALIQGVLRRHLIHIFMHDFPEHYGEVLLMVLKGCSENKLMPSILLELLNTIYKLTNCPELDANSDSGKMKEDILYFATNQKLFSYRDLYETIALFARHFQNERLQHGLNGLYPIHKNYCKWISVMFETFVHSLIVSAVHTNPGALSDTLIDWIWPSVCEMFSPWLFPYYPQNLPNLPANWIRQFNTPILLPWSELYSQYSQMLLHSFINCIQFMLDTFPACDLILSNIFYWYETNFGNVAVPRHVLLPTHSSLILLPWNRLKPTPLNIAGFHRLLQQYLPDCHSFLGHIFLRVNWTPWFYSNIHQWDYVTRNRILSTLLLMFVKLSYEPNVRENLQLLTLLQEAITFPWHMLDYQGIEGTFDWYVMSTEPSSILCLNSEHSAVDNSILSLLQTASTMITVETEHSQPPSQLQGKRILYVKTIVRLLRLCGSKYQQLLTTPDGIKSFHSAIFNLLSLINGIVTKEHEADAVNMMVEIISSIQLQGEFTSRIFVDAIAVWQSQSEIGNVVVSATLNALGMCKTFSNNMLMLLETTVVNYFRQIESQKNHTPSWKNVLQRLGPNLPTFDAKQMFDGEHLLCIHLSMIYKLKELHESGEKITYLQSIGKLLENYKSSLSTESKLVVIWGLLITCGFFLLEPNENAREPLLTLARHLKTTSNVSDGWGEGLLGAIGLKKESTSNKRKIIAKCLTCIIFSLFLDSEAQRKEYDQAFEDLKNSVKSKKFADIRSTAAATIDLVENQSKTSSNTKENICAVIRLFYSDGFLMSLEEIWSF